MKVKREQNIVEYGSKAVKLDALLAQLAAKDSKAVAKFLVEKTSLPRELRTNALRLVLNDYVKMAKELDLSDEFMYRLNWYEKFSEYQLVNFWNILATKNADKFNEKKEVIRFKETFYLLLLINSAAVGFSDKELNELLALPKDSEETFTEFLNESNDAFYDFEFNFDGLSYEDFKAVLKKSSTVADIRNIAAKYGINVPKRLKKEEFVALVAEGLRRQGKYDETTEEKLRKMSAISLQRFAKTNGINASTEMKKDDIIDYIMNRIESAPKSVRKPRIELVSLPELEEFKFSKEYLREVNIVMDEDGDDNETLVLDSTQVGTIAPTPEPVEEPVVEEAPAEEPVVEEAPAEEPVVEEAPAEEPVVEETPAEEPVVVQQDTTSKELIESLVKLLEERGTKEQEQLIKMYESRINFLEQALLNSQKAKEETPCCEQPAPLPIDIHVTVPETTPEVVKIIEPVVVNNLGEEPKPLEEVIGEPVVEEGTLEPVVVDSSFDELTAPEKKDTAKRLFKEAEEVVYSEDPVKKSKLRRERKKVKKLAKKQAKLDKREMKLTKIALKNEKRAYRHYKRRRFWKTIWFIFWMLVLLALLVLTFLALVDFEVLKGSIVETIEQYIAYVPGLDKEGVVRKTIYDLVSKVIGFFNK